MCALYFLPLNSFIMRPTHNGSRSSALLLHFQFSVSILPLFISHFSLLVSCFSPLIFSCYFPTCGVYLHTSSFQFLSSHFSFLSSCFHFQQGCFVLPLAAACTSMLVSSPDPSPSFPREGEGYRDETSFNVHVVSVRDCHFHVISA